MNQATATIITSETTSEDGDGPEPSLGCDPDQPPEPMSDPKTVLTIQCAGLDNSIDLTWLETQLSKAIGQIARPVQRVTIKLVDDREMVLLHKSHCDDNSTTDVLTFENSAESDAVDVDIAICVDEAHRQATNFNHNINQELLLYAIHGLLHCAGFDDKTDEQSRAIHKEEDRILAAIGVGAIYKRNETGHDASCDSKGRDRGYGS